MDIFVDEHYCVSENIVNNVNKFGVKKPISIFGMKINHPTKYKKKKHDGFNIIYYNPANKKEKSFNRWLYGIDIIEEVKKEIPDINWIELDGSYDMEKIYTIADFCLRPNRHDGESRIIQECEINDIPYYRTYTGNADVDEIIRLIKKEYKSKTQ